MRLVSVNIGETLVKHRLAGLVKHQLISVYFCMRVTTRVSINKKGADLFIKGIFKQKQKKEKKKFLIKSAMNYALQFQNQVLYLLK